MTVRLPRTARDLFRLKAHDRLLFDVAPALIEATGILRYPVAAEGDLEHMGLFDKVYWFYKARYPIRRARRGWGLEEFFARQERGDLSLPDDFHVERQLRVSAVGDLMTHAYLERSGTSLYSRVAEPIFGAAVSMANLECPIVEARTGELRGDGHSAPLLAFDRQTLGVVAGGDERRFDFVSAANNHVLDFGPAGVDSTIRALREEGIPFHGINADDDDGVRATIIRRDGFTLGVVGFTFGLNGNRPPADRPLLVNRMPLNGPLEAIDFSLLDSQLCSSAEAGADLTVAQLHWGMEFESYPTPEQVQVAHGLAERGVDLILGHHPHVVQPIELYRTRRDPARVVPIYYSLGNLVNPCSAPFMCRSLVALVDLAKGTLADGTSRTYVRRAGGEEVVQLADQGRGTIALERLGVSPQGT